MNFIDRQDAGERLAAALQLIPLDRPVVLGIPRGGLPVAVCIAEVLRAPLGVIVARKLRAPGQPELAIGATASDGTTWIDGELARATGADENYLAEETKRQSAEARAREDRFDGRRAPVKGHTVIVADDGLATGSTAIAAVRSLRKAGASRVLLAVPVAPPHTVELLRGEADEVICLHEDEDFTAVGQYYQDFRQVEDEDVVKILENYEKKCHMTGGTKGRKGNFEL
ncbi:MAG: phosphoribosyltransferase [Planctomycetes bacterium]|nr:phosphoribosyltransferase [Planctomycetota bacterium]